MGFDSRSSKATATLGLISMQERVRLSACSIRREPVQWTTHIDLQWNADEERELTYLAHRSTLGSRAGFRRRAGQKDGGSPVARQPSSSVVPSALNRPDCWAPNRNCLPVPTAIVLRLEADPNLADREPLSKTALESRGRTGAKREDPAHGSSV